MCNSLLVAKAENEKVLLKIEYDDTNESPREWDNLGTMICWKRGYTLGDEHNYSEPRDFLEGLAEDFTNMDREKLWDKTDNQLMEIIERYAVVLPLYVYEHSGITMNTRGYSCRWDSGQVGWTYITKAKIREEYSCRRVSAKLKELVENYLRSEVETYATYLEGSVFGFILEDKETGEHIDSCWGFYGYDFMTNGMKDHISAEYWDLLKEVG